jgi:hypothetical protein
MKVKHTDGRIETVRFGAIVPAWGWQVIEDATLRERIENAINAVSAENGSNTPDFILAEFLTDCLAAFDKASRAREKWYGKELSICGGVTSIPEDTTQ